MPNPILYEINTRTWLRGLSRIADRAVDLGSVPQAAIEDIARAKPDLVWLMGVWRTGPRANRAAWNVRELVAQAKRLLPDFEGGDLGASPYAIAAYEVDERLGGAAGLTRLRARLEARGIGLILDVVPNHTGWDHHWLREQPEVYVPATDEDLARSPGAFGRAGDRVFACGRDPFFPPWSDTAQLNTAHPRTRATLAEVFARVGELADGARCDMAMLLLRDVFARTWGERIDDPEPAVEAWEAIITSTRARHPDFLFLAEAYWNRQVDLIRLGFDYAYDKALTDHLVGLDAGAVRTHLEHWPGGGACRFLENHDEPRAASAIAATHRQAAAIVSATLPGMLLLHEGQLEGNRIHIPVQLERRPREPVDVETRRFYHRLLELVSADPAIRSGRWRPLPAAPAWEGNDTHRGFLAWEWLGYGGGRRWVIVNYGKTQGQTLIRGAPLAWRDREIHFAELLRSGRYAREGAALIDHGLFVDLPAGGSHLFEVSVGVSVPPPP